MGLLDRITEWLLARRQHRLGRSGDWEIVIVHKMPIVGPLRHVLTADEFQRIEWTATSLGGQVDVACRPGPHSIPVLRDLVVPGRDRLQIERGGVVLSSAMLRTMTYDRLSGVVRLHGDSQRDMEENLMEVRR